MESRKAARSTRKGLNDPAYKVCYDIISGIHIISVTMVLKLPWSRLCFIHLNHRSELIPSSTFFYPSSYLIIGAYFLPLHAQKFIAYGNLTGNCKTSHLWHYQPPRCRNNHPYRDIATLR